MARVRYLVGDGQMVDLSPNLWISKLPLGRWLIFVNIKVLTRCELVICSSPREGDGMLTWCPIFCSFLGRERTFYCYSSAWWPGCWNLWVNLHIEGGD